MAQVRFTIPPELLSDEAIRKNWDSLDAPRPFFTYHRCSECGLLFCPIHLSEESIGELMAASPPNMVGELDASINAQTQLGYWRFFETHNPVTSQKELPSRTYFELGPDVGTLARAAEQSRFFNSFILVEPNTSLHGRLKAQIGSHKLFISRFLNELPPAASEEKLGLAIAVHVLDHLVNPQKTLAKIHSQLATGGKLLVVVHNEGSLLAGVLGSRWYPYCLQHPQLFRKKTLKETLKRAGFGNIQIQRSSNVFPFPFLIKKLIEALGAPRWIQNVVLRLPPWPLLNLPLGNMIGLAEKIDVIKDQHPD